MSKGDEYACRLRNFYEVLRADPVTDQPMGSRNLPEMPRRDVVSFPIAKLKQFRHDFALLQEFASIVCDVPVDKLATIHMVLWLRDFKKDNSL